MNIEEMLSIAQSSGLPSPEHILRHLGIEQADALTLLSNAQKAILVDPGTYSVKLLKVGIALGYVYGQYREGK